MKNTSTRLLLSCAAIGVAGGLLFIVNSYVGGTVNAVVPMLYGLTLGVYFVPGVIAQALFRRGGVALLVAVLSGLVSAAFQPLGFGAALIAAAIGAVQEIPFLIARYRVWRTWLFLVGAAVSGVILAFGMYRLVGSHDLDVMGAVILLAGSFVSPIVFTLLGLALARALAAAGVGRGLARR
ncbi:ECF transporter S component [Herbiconiux moechotypicola]|uniref:Energy-coupling factor transport system substrate-specific component n=1 Tax=Herbiconiux moechotypicola TaxID=637393 RepID=A0ABP5QKU8_9MICO|nr:ECF transporter S component [Herbiconiux moechotypicola]MCS5730197.1 ECF transporter S component [Herbiconiux moechotypicola]